MSRFPSSFKSDAAVVGLGQLIEQACIFARNLVIVRSLTRDEYGAAATLLVSLAIVQASTDFGIQKLLIQDRRGDDPLFQRTAQLANFLQGLLVASLLLVAGPALASVFKLPHMANAYQALAVVPLLIGLTHFDIYRAERRSDFKPAVASRIAGQILSVIVVVVLSSTLRDYRILLWSMISIPFGTLVASHVLSGRPFRFGRDAEILRDALAFGWPLVANGVFFVIVNQSDRFLLGSSEKLLEAAQSLFPTFADVDPFTKSDLALYSIALTLTFMPTRLVVGTLSTIIFPLLSGLRDDRERMHELFAVSLRVNALLAALVSVGFLLFGASLVALIYGESYRDAFDVIGLLALVQGARLLRVPVFAASFALGDSRLPMFSNMFRALSVVGSAIVVLFGLSLSVLAAVALVTEIGTVLMAIVLLDRAHGFPRRLSFDGVSFFFATGAAALISRPLLVGLSDLVLFGLTAAALLAVLGAAWISLPRVYREGLALITSRGAKSSSR